MTLEDASWRSSSRAEFVVPTPRPAPQAETVPDPLPDVVDLRGLDASVHRTPTAEPEASCLIASPAPTEQLAAQPASPAESPQRWQRGYLRKLVCSDAAAAAVGAIVAYQLRFGAGATRTEMVAYLSLILALPVLWVLSVTLARGYETRFLGVGSEEYRRVSGAAMGVTAGVGLVSWGLELDVARGYVVIALPLATVITLVQRYIIRKALHRRRSQGREHGQTVVVVGHVGSVSDMVRQVHSARYHGMQVIAACTPTGAADDGLAQCGVPVVGTFEDVIRVVRHVRADAVAVLPCPEMDGAAMRRLGWELETTDAELLVAPSVIEVVGPRISIRPVCGLPLLHVERPELTGIRRFAKGMFDRVIAALSIVALSPLLLAVGAFVAIGSRGPVLYRQRRVGLGGREFTIFKFRTMICEAGALQAELDAQNEAAGPLFKLRRDPRITSAGHVLRRYSVDELPQMVNVLLGHMSLVGPRPPLPREVEGYEDAMRRRLLVKPGLTGLWQINGRSDLDWDESMRLDLRYVENWSFAFDFMILWKTAAAVLRGRGAY